MRRRSKAFLGLLACALAPAAPAFGQTIEEALAAAYRNNPTLEAQRAALRATDELVPQALSGWRPSATVEGDVGRADTFSNVRTAGGDKQQIRTPRGVALNVTQPLFRGFRTEAATDQAEHTVLAGRYRLLSIEQQVLLSAATAFMDVLRNQAVVDLNINNEQVLQRQLEATRDRFEVGELTRTDVSQAEARLARATADRIQAEGDLDSTRAAYRNVVGMPPVRLVQPATPGGLPLDQATALKLAEDDNPNVLATVYDEKAARDRVDGIKGELLPTLSLTGSLSRDLEASSSTSRAHEKSITATLSMPLYESGSVYSRVRQAKQSVGQERMRIEQARRDAIEAATQWWERLMTARARVVSLSAQVRANEIALEGVEREAAVGARTVIDVLDAEQELLNARVSLVSARRDEVVAAFGLKSAVGDLTASELGLPVEYYNPVEHYREVRGKWFGTGVNIEDGETGAQE